MFTIPFLVRRQRLHPGSCRYQRPTNRASRYACHHGPSRFAEYITQSGRRVHRTSVAAKVLRLECIITLLGPATVLIGVLTVERFILHVVTHPSHRILSLRCNCTRTLRVAGRSWSLPPSLASSAKSDHLRLAAAHCLLHPIWWLPSGVIVDLALDQYANTRVEAVSLYNCLTPALPLHTLWSSGPSASDTSFTPVEKIPMRLLVRNHVESLLHVSRVSVAELGFLLIGAFTKPIAVTAAEALG